jgi:hypothetical protein
MEQEARSLAGAHDQLQLHGDDIRTTRETHDESRELGSNKPLQDTASGGAVPESALAAATRHRERDPREETNQNEAQQARRLDLDVDQGVSPQARREEDSSSGHDGSCAPAGTSSPLVLETLRAQMHAGFQRRNEKFCQKIFDKHKSPDYDGLSRASLGQALSDLGVRLNADELEELFYTQDLNSDGWISWSEFLMVISRPSKIEEWATMLPLAALLVDCMPSRDEAELLRGLSKLHTADMQAISACFSEGLVQLLRCVPCVRVRRVCVRNVSWIVYMHAL